MFVALNYSLDEQVCELQTFLTVISELSKAMISICKENSFKAPVKAGFIEKCSTLLNYFIKSFF